MIERARKELDADRVKQTDYPLSFAQERLWFIEQLEPGTPIYNLAWMLKLDGPLNLSSLQQALDYLVERHEILRTSYSSRQGVPVQHVQAVASVPFRLLDLQNELESEQDEFCKQAFAEEVLIPFDLSETPILRVLAVRRSSTAHDLLLVSHHIATDGWSQRILSTDLAAAYQAIEGGHQPVLEQPVLQFPAYAALEREASTRRDYRDALSYWKHHLEGLPDALSLPTDRPRSSEPDYNGRLYPVEFSASLAARLNKLARKLRATPFMVLAAAIAALLGRYAQEDDLAIGFPIAGRTQSAADNTVGCFVNTLVLRAKLGEVQTFDELVLQVRDSCLDAYDHQQTPFEQLVMELQPHRESNRTPLFQVMFAFNSFQDSAYNFGKATGRMEPYDREVAKFDLRFNLTEREERISGVMTSRIQLFDSWRIEQMIKHLSRILHAVVDKPDTPFRKLDLLSPDEHRALDLQAYGPSLPIPSQTVNDMLREQAKTAPSATAVEDGVNSLTYAELDDQATRVATELQEMGVATGDRVGLCLAESADCLAVFYGILRAGAAAVPLNPYDPAARVRESMDRAALRLAVSDHEWAEKLQGAGPEILYLSTLAESPRSRSRAHVRSESDPDALAYVLFTSGSSGVPKGVEVTNANIMAYLTSVKSTLQLPQGASCLWLQPITADTSFTTLLGALAVGGCIHVVHPSERVDVHAVERRVRASEPDVTKIAPTHLLSLLEAAERPNEILPKELLILGGEALSWNLVKRVRALAPDLRIFNHYGPTETTVGVTGFRIPPGDCAEFEGWVPIGKPFQNTTAYVVDRNGLRCPHGIPGELWIGGPQVARGYMADASLTASAFIDDPFCETATQHLYRTGDRVVRKADGALEFLGRLDGQVKIRGFRVEPAEALAKLLELPAIADAVVVPDRLDNNRHQLIAYYVLEEGEVVQSHDLAKQLASELPAYLLPSVYIALDALPRLAHGKIDRAALPTPVASESRELRECEGPQTPIEAQLIPIWENVLERKPIGRDDVFFELGGHSLLALRLLSLIEREMSVRIPIRALFETPTVAGLGDFIQNRQ